MTQVLIVGPNLRRDCITQKRPLASIRYTLLRQLTKIGLHPMDVRWDVLAHEWPEYGNMARAYLTPSKQAKADKMPTYFGLHAGQRLITYQQALTDRVNAMKPKLVIGLGDWPLWALTDEAQIDNGTRDKRRNRNTSGYKIPKGIAARRGSQYYTRDGIPFLPLMHPAEWTLREEWGWLSRGDLHRRVPLALSDNWAEPKRTYHIEPTYEQAQDWLYSTLDVLEQSYKPVTMSVDIETAIDSIECVSWGWNESESYCLPLMTLAGTGPDYWPPFQEAHLVSLLVAVLTHPNVEVLGQNFNYDMQYFLQDWMARVRYRYDSQICQAVLYPGLPSDLGTLSSLYCAHHRYWKDDGKVASKSADDRLRWRYNCEDVCRTLEVHNRQLAEIANEGLETQYGFQMLRVHASGQMSLTGFRHNKARQWDEYKKHQTLILQYEEQLHNMVPAELIPDAKTKTPWFNSPPQLANFLYTVLGLDPHKDIKTGAITTNDDALDKIGKEEPMLKPLCDAISQLRSLRSFEQFLTMRPDTDQRIRCTYSPTTETYRYRSSPWRWSVGRNLQNIPKGAEK